jgi:cytochrome c5
VSRPRGATASSRGATASSRGPTASSVALHALLAASLTLSRALALGPAALLAPLVARAQSAGEWRSSEQLWRATCAYCHNDHLAAELRGTSISAQAIAGAVRAGPNAMPSFTGTQISDGELHALADWLTRQKRPAAEETDRVPRHSTRER